DRWAAGLLQPDVHDQRQRVQVRPLPQCHPDVPYHRRRRFLLRRQAGERAHGAAESRDPSGRADAQVPGVPERDPRVGEPVRVLHRRGDARGDRVSTRRTWDRIADLPFEVESHSLEGLELAFSEEFTRMTTLIKLQGGGFEGIGEDVVYD